MKNKEYRTIHHGQVEKREDGDGYDFRGLASRTGHEYTLAEFENEIWTEVIDVNAFRDVLDDDVRVLFNHSESQILGRTGAGTAKVWADIDGLKYAWKTPNTTLGKDITSMIERGDISQSSFGFSVRQKDNIWERTTLEDGRRKIKRTILKVEELYDVSPVTFPANPDTYAGRSVKDVFEDFRKAIEAEEAEIVEEIPGMSVDFAERMTLLNERII